MKQIITLAVALLLSIELWAQSPEKMSYQAIIRNSNQKLVSVQEVGMQISIIKDAVNGNVVYTETQSPTTNENGLISIEIGTGETDQDFSVIDWATGIYFIQTEVDPDGGTDYSIVGTSQLLSVPYALYAKNAGNAFSGNYADLNNKPDLDKYLTAELDSSKTNELQALSISNDTIFLTDGGFVKLPAGTSFSGSFNDLTNIPSGLSDGDDNTQLTEIEVDTYVSNNGYLTLEVDGSITNEIQVISISNDTIFLSGGGFVKLPASVGFSGSFNDLGDIPNSLVGYGITDAMNTSHIANGITASNIGNWNTAFGWGDHSAAGYEASFSKNTAFNKDFGTASGTVAQGDDSRITNGQTAFSWGNHSAAGYEATFSKNTAFNKNFGTSTGTVAQGDDSRIINGQTAFSWGNHSSAGYEAGFSKNTAFNKDFGTASGTVAQGDDSRITNGQTAFSWGNHSSAGYEVSFSKNTAFNKNFGTSTGTVAQGDDSRIVNGQTAFSWGNHSSAGYEAGFSKNTAFNKDFGTTTGTVAQGNDSRIVNGQTAYGWGNHSSAGYEAGFTKNTAFNKNFGTASGTVAQGNDSRITNGQTAYSWGDHSSAGYLNSVAGSDIALGSDTQGDIMYYNGTNWVRLGAGTSGQVLQTNGAGANPSWANASGGSSSSAVIKSSNYTIQAGENVIISNAISTITFTLPTAATAGSGAVLHFYGITNNFNISTSESIYDENGDAQTTLSSKYIIILVSDGVNKWYQMK